ncbi:hypothetical protein QBC46DRAFT_252280 [Diplogelasinospora grovesii]|uniref:Uncharacterized protein n=1 Tax=Diplogelasinospora grovesii TaxID=303347 RepID=A0AAN6NEB7_9PEZI|nr:hypothetical protein QBC46DRAFT_252280 [Diplogelasinospora grovesii]
MPGLVQTSVLPAAEIRNNIAAKQGELVIAILSHSLMRNGANMNPTLHHLWDFVMRTSYILSELENIEAGRPVQYPNQIPGYAPSIGPSPDKAKESMIDVITRSHTVEMMLTGPPGMIMMMGLQPVEFGEEIKAKSAAVMEACSRVDISAL